MQQDLQTLVARKLEGTITPEELTALEALMASSPEAAQEYAALEEIWNTSRNLTLHKGLQPDDRWRKLQSKMAAEVPAAKSRKMIWLRYAAAAATFVVLAVIYLMNKQHWVTVTTSVNEIRSVTLPDSSIIELKGNTYLSYNSSEWNSSRNVRLKGEAFFDVRKNGVSFVVESANARIAVLGTSFNVNSSAQQTVVTCFSGKVSVANKVSDNAVILTHGLETIVQGDLVTEPYQAKAAGPDVHLNFNKAPLWTVFESLESYYGKPIVVQGAMDSVSFTGNLEGASLESALKTVCLSAGLEFTITPDSVIVK